MLSTPEFWVAVGFVILVAAIARPVWRGLTGALDARSERIQRTLDEARTLHEEAQHLLAEYQRKQRDAAGEAERMIERARIEAERLRVEATEALGAQPRTPPGARPGENRPGRGRTRCARCGTPPSRSRSPRPPR